MRRAVQECTAAHVPVSPQLLKPWLQGLMKDTPEAVLYIGSDTLQGLILPAYHLLKPKDSYYDVSMPSINNVNPSKGRFNLTKFLESGVGSSRAPSLCNERAGQALPPELQHRPEIIAFTQFSNRLLTASPSYLVTSVVFPESFNYTILIDLTRRKMEIISCLHHRLNFHQVKEWEDSLVWFSLYQFNQRVTPTHVLKSRPDRYLCTISALFYLMLRLRFDLTLESASLTCTLQNIQRFIGFLTGTNSTDVIEIRSNLTFSGNSITSGFASSTASPLVLGRQATI